MMDIYFRSSKADRDVSIIGIGRAHVGLVNF